MLELIGIVAVWLISSAFPGPGRFVMRAVTGNRLFKAAAAPAADADVSKR